MKKKKEGLKKNRSLPKNSEERQRGTERTISALKKNLQVFRLGNILMMVIPEQILLKWDNVTFSRGALSRLFFASNCIALDICSYLSEIGDAFRGLIARFYSTHKAIHDFNFPRICFLVQLVD